MRILAVSDVVDPSLYDHFDPVRWESAGVDLLISCGDLPADYLSYLVSRFNVPLFYVPGNHDESYREAPPEGAESIDGRLIVWRRLRILGLGGSAWYNGGYGQYRDWMMRLRVLRLTPWIWHAGGIDLIVTHAPPAYPPPVVGGAGQAAPARPPDRVHRGFPIFTELIHAYHPRALLHGHTHLGYGTRKRVIEIEGTRVVDVYGHYLLDL